MTTHPNPTDNEATDNQPSTPTRQVITTRADSSADSHSRPRKRGELPDCPLDETGSRPDDCSCQRHKAERYPCQLCKQNGFDHPAPRIGDVVLARFPDDDALIGEIRTIQHVNGKERLIITTKSDSGFPPAREHDCIPSIEQILSR